MKITALAGGVGGAKLALGLYHALDNPADLTVIGNTGDDLEMFGLYICPDLDTVMYTLADIVHPGQGWGIEGDTYELLNMLKRYGEDTWFLLGDRDFATHVVTTQMLRAGQTLTQVIDRQARQLGLKCRVLPMCNEPVRTMVQTVEAGELAFQEYFVKRRAADTVTGLRFAGAENATLTDEVREAITEADLIIICPSNPYLSVWPILSVAGMRDLLQNASAPIVAVSNIVGGQAIKGPAAKIMQSMGGEDVASATGVAKLYAGLATGFVLDEQDADQQAAIAALGFRTLVTQTIMKTLPDKTALAENIIKTFSSKPQHGGTEEG